MDKKIPMIGTAVVTNTRWVKRLVESVDFPVENFCIINNNGRGEINQELDDIAKSGNTFISKIHVIHLPSNLGVPASWNLMIKSYMMCPYWVIVNDDVAFCPGYLEELYEATTADPVVGVIHGYQGDYGVGSWDNFLIRDHIIQEFGLFDENLYPAYNEDADYIMRFVHRPIKRIAGLKSDYMHGEGKKNEYYVHGSNTGKSNSDLKTKLDEVNLINIDYLTKKWGPTWRYCRPEPEPKPTRHSTTYTSFDLNFCRSKHLGF